MAAVPRASHWPLSISLVALVVAAGVPQPALAAPSIEGVVEARGTAATFTIFGGGMALEGGTHDWSVVCGGCTLRITFEAADSFLVVQNGRVQSFGAGAYEVREFRGLVQFWKEGPGEFLLQLHGAGSVSRR